MRAPSYEPRRRKEIAAELVDRARIWLADWQPADDGDFATALFTIAARLESEVTQRLDRVPDRTFRGFLDWLGVRGKPGRAARLGGSRNAGCFDRRSASREGPGARASGRRSRGR